MDLAWLDGFLCAITCGPAPVPTSIWIPLVWRDAAPNFASKEQAARIVSLILRLANHVASTIERESYVPLLPEHTLEDLDNVAQTWCAGFVQGMSLQPSAWDPLLEDGELHMMLMPILVLGSPGDFVDELTPDPDAVAGLLSMLPAAVQMISAYWRGEFSAQPKTARAAKPSTARASRAKTSTVHRTARQRNRR